MGVNSDREQSLILIVEDEEDIAELIVASLSPLKDHFNITCTCTASGEEALRIHKKQKPRIVILDLQLPDLDGLSICSRIKKRDDESNTSTFVVIVTARNTEKDMILGYDLGVDDYITKPFSPRVLRAKIRSIFMKILSMHSLHNMQKHDVLYIDQNTGIRYGDVMLNREMKTLHIKSYKQFLSFIEWNILKLFLEHPERVFSRVEIINIVKGKNHPVTLRSVDVQIYALRKKLDISTEVTIQTVRSMGYKLTSKNIQAT